MKKSERTKKVQNLSFIFGLSSLLCWLGVAIFSVIVAFSKVGGSEKTGVNILSDALKTKLISLSITVIIGLICALLIKEKARTTVYMLSLLLLTIVYGETAMYIVLSIWFTDEYVLHSLHKHYKNLSTINKEIDLRG